MKTQLVLQPESTEFQTETDTEMKSKAEAEAEMKTEVAKDPTHAVKSPAVATRGIVLDLGHRSRGESLLRQVSMLERTSDIDMEQEEGALFATIGPANKSLSIYLEPIDHLSHGLASIGNAVAKLARSSHEVCELSSEFQPQNVNCTVSKKRTDKDFKFQA